jgi:DNA (cytosine-5)-methyltransferase 1
MNILSLFANIGVAEAYLEEIGFNVLVANEFEERRAKLYQEIYPRTNMVCGDITDNTIFEKVIKLSKNNKVEVIIATPPCQGMSTAGQQKSDDHRNNLIVHTISAIKRIKPKYILIENVPQFLKTKIHYNNNEITIPELIKNELSNIYHLNFNVVDSKNYSVAQTRERAIVLLSRKDQKYVWEVPVRDNKIVNLKDVIGQLPPIDPIVKDLSHEDFIRLFPKFEERRKKASKISKWHNPPTHVWRQVKSMLYTPTGKSAFTNSKTDHKPKKENGELVKGFLNTYKRQNWDTPGYTVTMDNVKISSQNNVHPGRLIGKDPNGNNIYSDPRTLTLYEIMRVMSIPEKWPIPENTSEAFLRRVIGEGVPPLMVKRFFEQLIAKNEK